MNENEIAKRVLDHCFTIHSSLGPGLLESAYKECLAFKLSKEGFYVEKEKPIPIVFEELHLKSAYRID
jgi:GxxExxY protein